MTAQLAALTKSLARPLMQRKLSAGQAYASLVNAIVQAERDGTLEGDADLAGQIDAWGKLLGQFLRNEDAERVKTRGGIVGAIKPLIGCRQSSNRILAEAHDINGAAGFPFTEREVEEIVSTEMFWALRRSGRRAG
jgi:hypothetical protein